MKAYRDCFCRNPQTGRPFGQGKCPELSKRTHGKWYARYEAPNASAGKRSQPRVGPYDTEREAKAAVAKAVGKSGRAPNSDRKIKFGAWLDKRHGWRKAEGELKPSTLASDAEAIELYLKPGLGHIKVIDMPQRADCIRDLYAAMRKINRPGELDEPDDLLRRLLKARASRDGERYSNRPLSDARIKRVHAVLRGALADAKASGIIDINPAAGLFKAKGGRKGRIRPLLWTVERVEHWEKTATIPGPVMVWTAAQCGGFLDFAEATNERMYPLFHLDAYWGLRRGELVGLDRPDVGLETKRLHIRQSQADDELDDTKTENSDRQVIFDDETARVLKAWRKCQAEEALRWGEAYADSNRFFTREDGSALRPDNVSARFNALVERYTAIRRRYAEGWTVERIARQHRVPVDAVRIAVESSPLPPIRFHDLRHGAATMLLASGAPMKLVADVLGHASSSFTSDVYAVVAEELAEQAARAIVTFIPRRRHG